MQCTVTGMCLCLVPINCSGRNQNACPRCADVTCSASSWGATGVGKAGRELHGLTHHCCALPVLLNWMLTNQ